MCRTTWLIESPRSGFQNQTKHGLCPIISSIVTPTLCGLEAPIGKRRLVGVCDDVASSCSSRATVTNGDFWRWNDHMSDMATRQSFPPPAILRIEIVRRGSTLRSY